MSQEGFKLQCPKSMPVSVNIQASSEEDEG